MLGDTVKMPVISPQGPTISFVAYDVIDLTPTSNGTGTPSNAGVVIFPNFVGLRSIAVNNVQQSVAFAMFPKFYTGGDFDFTTIGTTGYQSDNWLSDNFTGSTLQSGKFVRARINSVSIEGIYTGAPLYAQGTTTIQIFDPASTNGGGVVVPVSRGALCNSYRTMAMREGFIFSLPNSDRQTAALTSPSATSAGTTGFLGVPSYGGGWPAVAIRLIGCDNTAQSIYRIVVKRLIDVEMAPINSVVSAMASAHPISNSSAVYNDIHRLSADVEQNIHVVPTDQDPEETVYTRLTNMLTWQNARRAVDAGIRAAPHIRNVVRGFHTGNLRGQYDLTEL
jgi:hypothetical protein